MKPLSFVEVIMSSQEKDKQVMKPTENQNPWVALSNKWIVIYNTYKTCLTEVTKPKHRHTHRLPSCYEAIFIYNTHQDLSDKGDEAEAEAETHS